MCSWFKLDYFSGAGVLPQGRHLLLMGKGCNPTHLANFNQVQSIPYSNSEDKNRKEMLPLKIASAPEPLTVPVPSLAIVMNMADLIDGYCQLVNGVTQSFAIRPQKESKQDLPSIPKLAHSQKQGVQTHIVSVSETDGTAGITHKGDTSCPQPGIMRFKEKD